jgi:hypothetical protein
LCRSSWSPRRVLGCAEGCLRSLADASAPGSEEAGASYASGPQTVRCAAGLSP